MLEILDGEGFASKVMESQSKVFVEFFATWCPHCKREQPIIDELAAEFNGEVPVYQVDVDKSPSLAVVYAPKGFPTYVLFDNGVAVDSLTGEQPIERLREMIARTH